MSVLSKIRVISQIDPDKARDREERKRIYEGIGGSAADAINIAGSTGVDEKLLFDIGREISDPSSPILIDKLKIITPSSPKQVPPESIVKWLEENLYNIAMIPAPLNTTNRKITYEVRKEWIDAFDDKDIKFPSRRIFFVGYIFLNPNAICTHLVNADPQRGIEKLEDYIEESARWCEGCYLENSGAYADPNLIRRAKVHAVKSDLSIEYGGGIATPERGREMAEAGRVYLDKEKKIPSYTTLILGDIVHKDLVMHSKIAEVIKNFDLNKETNISFK